MLKLTKKLGDNMKYEWLDSFLLSKKGSIKDFKAEWGATRYMINSKMFAMIGTDNNNRPIVSFKCDPAFGQLLREQYKESVIAGYYLNKIHWNSVFLDGSAPDDVVRHMADQSYDLILSSFSKKVQKEIRGEI